MVLAVNCGSSSIKLAVYDGSEKALLKEKIKHVSADSIDRTNGTVPDIDPAGKQIKASLMRANLWEEITVVGHRIVHGRDHKHPLLIDEPLIKELNQNVVLAPMHMAAALAVVKFLRDALPQTRHVACFDTCFHSDLPEVARFLPVPRQLTDKGVIRYGFHGLSCTYLLQKFAEIAGPAAAAGRVIIAHLGSGASMTAIKENRSIDTTMGFTPEAGLMMGTRPGDIDPGIISYLFNSQGYDPTSVQQMLVHQCGLLGVSETSSDMAELLEISGSDERARQAVDLFCYSAKKSLCGLCGALGGLDTLIFSGGIGENLPSVRSRICAGLGFLGINLDPVSNNKNSLDIGLPDSPVRILVIKTEEELVIARQARELITSLSSKSNNDERN